MSVSDEQKALVVYQTRLQVFLWTLLRDHVAFGVAEEILLKHVSKIGGVPPDFDDPNLAAYSLALADRILRGPINDNEGRTAIVPANLREFTEKVALYLGANNQAAMMTCAEDGSTFDELRAMARDILMRPESFAGSSSYE
jgi:hypothetical protein